MSQENVEVVRKVFASFGRDPDTGLELIDADAVVDWTASRGPYSGVYRGHAEIRRFRQAFNEAWDEFAVELSEVVEVDSETLVCATVIRGRGKGSGVPIEAQGAWVGSVRDGKVIYAAFHQSKAEALEAVGLSEQDAHADS